jgi:hypothetical protein
LNKEAWKREHGSVSKVDEDGPVEYVVPHYDVVFVDVHMFHHLLCFELFEGS